MLVLADEPASRTFLRTLSVAKREFEYTVLDVPMIRFVQSGLMHRGLGLTTANAEVKCNVEEGIGGGEDLRNGNGVRNNGA